jgi:hypothetical protein
MDQFFRTSRGRHHRFLAGSCAPQLSPSPCHPVRNRPLYGCVAVDTSFRFFATIVILQGTVRSTGVSRLIRPLGFSRPLSSCKEPSDVRGYRVQSGFKQAKGTIQLVRSTSQTRPTRRADGSLQDDKGFGKSGGRTMEVRDALVAPQRPANWPAKE